MGGRHQVREVLYMAAPVAVRHNPALRASLAEVDFETLKEVFKTCVASGPDLTDYLSDAELNLDLNPISGTAIDKMLKELYATPKNVLERAAQAATK